MSDSATITREQLRTVLIATELGGKTGDSNHFSYAELGSSTYSFGQMQFDVGNAGREVKMFLKNNGFDSADITILSQHGGLSRKDLDALDAKLQAIPQDKMDQFTNGQLDKSIAGVGGIIDGVRKQNPAAADAITKDLKLQLGIADYTNQFPPPYPQLTGFLAGNPQTLGHVKVHAGNPPTREDIQTFIGAGKYGQDPANARGIKGRAERLDGALHKLNLDHSPQDVRATSSLPVVAPGPEDPRNAFNLNYALYNELHRRIPEASENRLLQFTAACHEKGMTADTLSTIHLNGETGKIVFTATGLVWSPAIVDLNTPSPQPAQSIQHIRQTDQHQAQIQVQAQIAQTNALGQQGPMLGGW